MSSTHKTYQVNWGWFFNFFRFLFIYLFHERERESEQVGERMEEEGEREIQADSTLSVEPEVGLNYKTLRLQPKLKSKPDA